MTGATHMLAAAVICASSPTDKPIITLGLAFLSHFLLDMIPHYEPGKKVNYILGVIAGIFLLIISWYKGNITILIAAFLGAFPDLNWMFNIWKPLDRIHSAVHFKFEEKVPFWAFYAEMLASVLLSVYISIR